jgi:hypothetical protein
LSRAEQNAILSLTLHNLLIGKGLNDEARIAWVLHLNVSTNAEGLGEHFEAEIEVA